MSGVWCLVSNARWLRTGDEVRFDAQGNIFITDRIKVRSVQPLPHDFYPFRVVWPLTSRTTKQDLIKVKGLQVAPSELEGYLLGHPDVADAAVIGVPDDYAGELPRAYVVLKPEVADAVVKDSRLVAQVKAKLYEVSRL